VRWSRGGRLGGRWQAGRWLSRCSALALGLAALLSPGCSSQDALNPALRLEQEDYQRAVERGRSLVGGDPYKAFRFSLQQPLRVTPQVTIREAACCWPQDEIAFAIAKQNDRSDEAVNRAARNARRQAEREVGFSLVLQIQRGYDPSSVRFLMRTSSGQSYPPLSVDAPVYLRDVATALDAPDTLPSALYGYDMHFPIQGSPGFPPIGPEVSSLSLVVQDEQLEAAVTFPMPAKAPRY
jgi:hypothetical protein